MIVDVYIFVFDRSGVLVSVKTRANQSLHKLKESYDHLVQRVTELQERADKLVIHYTYTHFTFIYNFKE